MPPKKKKLTKKEKQRIADEYEKQMKAQAEQERLKQLKEEKERLEKEKKLAKEKAKREILEQDMRVKQLSNSCDLFKKLKNEIDQVDEENRAAEEWKKYMKCDGLPDPASFSQMNTYLFLWTRDDHTNNIDEVLKKTDEVIQLLNVMDELIQDPPQGIPTSHVQQWMEIRKNLRVEQQSHLDTATYRLLRHIEENLLPIDLTASKLQKTCEFFTLNLWAGIPTPISVAQATEIKQSMTVEFNDVGVSCSLPPSVARHDMAIRALWLKYDHWSDQCPSFDCPSLIKNNRDLNEETLVEWNTKSDMQSARDEKEKEKRVKKGSETLNGNATGNGKSNETTRVSVSDLVLAQQEEEAQALKLEMTKDTGPHQVNLRKYCVLGGVLYLDLVQQPPQPRDLRGKYRITVLDTPPGLNPVQYYEHYVPPPPPEPGVRRAPEEIEVEVKKHEEALEKIGSVTLKFIPNIQQQIEKQGY